LRGQNSGASALIDTGFTGDLVIPTRALNDTVGLPDARIDWQLADGSVVDAPVYLGTIEVVGIPPIAVAITTLGNEYILGRGVIDRYRVTFDRGQRIIVEE